MTPASLHARLTRIEKALASQGALGGLSAAEQDQMDVEAELKRLLARNRDFYVYESQALSLAASGTATDVIQIEADAHFVLQKLAHVSYDDAAPPDLGTSPTVLFTGGLTAQQQVLPQVSIQITDTGSGRQLMSNPIPIPSLFGDGKLPFILPNPRIFLKNTTLQIGYTNFDTVNPYDIRLAFIGYKIYTK